MKPLYDALIKYNNLNPVRLHTPGHKGKLGKIFESISPFDITEISASDDPFYPTGPILKAEKLAAEFFGVKNTYFSAGGATLCVQTALSFFSGEKVIFDRNSHLSAFNTAALCDITPIFIYNKTHPFALPMPITPEQAEEAIKNNPDAKALFLTSPNYFGLTADLPGIYFICKSNNIPLIVDNAHGSHIIFLDRKNCAEENADFIISSAHKTLPVLTGGAYLHVNYNLQGNHVKRNMRMFGSTSPSFLILASLDYAREWCEINGEKEFKNMADSVRELSGSIVKAGFCVLKNTEPARITVHSPYEGKAIAAGLEEAGIFPEMSDSSNVVLLFSPFISSIEYKKIKSYFSLKKEVNTVCQKHTLPQTEFLVQMKKAMFSPREKIPLNLAVNRIAASPIIPYPPGVPLLLPGEHITQAMVDFLNEIGLTAELEVLI